MCTPCPPLFSMSTPSKRGSSFICLQRPEAKATVSIWSTAATMPTSPLDILQTLNGLGLPGPKPRQARCRIYHSLQATGAPWLRSRQQMRQQVPMRRWKKIPLESKCNNQCNAESANATSANCCMLPAACCMLPVVVCCELPAARCLLPTACCLPACLPVYMSAACCMLSAACCLMPAACCLLPAVQCLHPTSPDPHPTHTLNQALARGDTPYTTRPKLPMRQSCARGRAAPARGRG